jgi:hypothetical protein
MCSAVCLLCCDCGFEMLFGLLLSGALQCFPRQLDIRLWDRECNSVQQKNKKKENFPHNDISAQ